MPINCLPIEVVHLIAAGEVIDSLAAVVRELAENAIDAGATRIVISIWMDTLSVQMSDNGCGMEPDDLFRAATPHTTSKINNVEDLQQIRSLGFRGEALHSLAQLADLQICSRPIAQPVGYQVHYDHQGNLTAQPKVIAIASGTVVTAQNLFSGYPNRLQSLPSSSQQVRKLQLQIQHMAIANPQVNWQVHLNDREWLTIWSGLNASEILPQIISSVQPYDLICKSLALNNLNGTRIQLTLGKPDRISRRRSDWIKIILNGRVITFPELEQTVLTALERILPRHRFPLCIVDLNLSCDRLDWNRHPAKNEVYIQNLEELQTQLKECISEALKLPEPSNSNNYNHVTNKLLQTAERKTAYLIPTKQETFNQPSFSIKAIAQVLDTYILAEHQGGLWLIEQHVAHERIIFEQIESQWQIVPISQAILLKQTSQISDRGVEQLQSLGMEVEAFGNNLWAVRSLPKILIDHPECAAVLQEMSQQEDLSLARATAACRSAVRNGTKLEMAFMRDLLSQWQQTRNPHTCPHGRPICLAIDESDLARFFRRNWLIAK